jgi:CBS domain-containing protein
MTARDVMTPNPITVPPTATLGEVAEVMREGDIRHVPVTRGGLLVGMLSDRDLAALDIGRALTSEGGEVIQRTLDTPVAGVMSSDVLFVDDEATLDDVIELMLEHKVGAIPVVLPGMRELIGIVSYIDVLRAVRALIAEE